MTEITWTLQVLLALLFLGAGINKLRLSKQRLLALVGKGAAGIPVGFLRFISICEVLGAIGMVAPRALGIHPELTALAAVGFIPIMVGAAVVHYHNHEFKLIAVNATVISICIFIAYQTR
jgi:hypothetical protein